MFYLSHAQIGKYCQKSFYFVEKVSVKVLVEQVDEGTTLNNKWLSIDINECKEGLDGCHVNAICNNTEGSYNCTCKPGFIGDGQNSCRGKVVIVIFIITIIRLESFSAPLPRLHLMFYLSHAQIGKYCQKSFYFVEKVSVKVLVEQVDEGTTLNNKWLSIDINECKEGLDGCHVNAICNNTEGSYNCTCKPGFIGDGQNSCRGKVVIVIFIIIIIIIRIESFTVSFASPSLNVGQRGP